MKKKRNRDYSKPQIVDCIRIVPEIICGSEQTVKDNKPDDIEYGWEEVF
jgi:hypothetical protein